jgi:hypothetical protein
MIYDLKKMMERDIENLQMISYSMLKTGLAIKKNI